MDKVKVGILDVGRARLMTKYCKIADNVEIVAVCDERADFLNELKQELNNNAIDYYSDFDEFLSNNMDAVVLAEHSDNHGELAIKCLKAGKHVLSEPMPVQNMSEAVALVEAVEASDKVYAFAEGHSYMPSTREMRKLYRKGILGNFEYGEGEYFHDCEPYWPDITFGDPNHWRNTMPATFYCAHSIGPIIHITGRRPVQVSAYELPPNEKSRRMGNKAGIGSLMMIHFDDGSLMKSLHGLAPSRTSIWYSLYGSKGRMETARDDAQNDDLYRIILNTDEYEGENNLYNVSTYLPKDKYSEKAETYSHCGSDFYIVWNFIEKIKGNPEAETIDVYEALDMSIPGICGYESLVQGNMPIKIPNFRNKLERERYRNEKACVNPQKAGDMVIKSCSLGEQLIPQEVYDEMRKQWHEHIGR